MRSIPRKLIISISRYIAPLSMAKMHLTELRASNYSRCTFARDAKYARPRKNAKSTKCIAQHIPTQLRSFPTKIFPVALAKKARVRILHASQACPLRVSTTTTTMTYRSVVIKMRLRLKNCTGLKLTEKEERRKGAEKFVFS